MTSFEFVALVFLLHDIRRRIMVQPGDRFVSAVLTLVLIALTIQGALAAW